MAQATTISTSGLRALILDEMVITALYEDGATVELDFGSKRLPVGNTTGCLPFWKAKIRKGTRLFPLPAVIPIQGELDLKRFARPRWHGDGLGGSNR